MAILRVKEINAMTKQEKEKKIQELRFELIKSRASASKGGNAKIFLTLTFLGWWFLMSGWHPKQIGPFESQEICDKVRNNYLTAGNICWFIKPNC